MAVVLVCAQVVAAASAAPVPAGPRLAYLEITEKSIELRTSGPAGEEPVRLSGGGRQAKTPIPLPFIQSQLSWSADGTTAAFVGFGAPRDKQVNLESAEVFRAFADGRPPQSVPGTVGGQFPVLAPDGRSVAYTRARGKNGSEVISDGKKIRTRRTFARTSIWIVPVDGGSARKLTPWRKRTREWPSSFSPDGSKLAITQSPPGEPARALVIDLNGGGVTTIARGAGYPVYSPDGSKIALFRRVDYQHVSTGDRATADVGVTSDLFVVDSDGSNPIRLTRTRALDLSPSWDPSGQRLAFISLGSGDSEAEALFGIDDSLMEVNADGSCLSKVFSSPGVGYLSPVWQPGPGREAGPISC